MRNYRYIDQYLNELESDIYDQPSDQGHSAWAKDVINNFVKPIADNINSVLDVGCGDGFCKPFFDDLGIDWTCFTLGKEHVENAIYADMSFLIDCPPNFYDLIFARHVLEHSPMPLLTLMEWYRVSNKYALVVLPSHEYWKFGGRNHYSILDKEQWKFLFERSKWKIVKESQLITTDSLFLDFWMEGIIKREDRHWKDDPQVVELRFLLEKIHG